MKTRILYEFAALLVLCCAMFGCKKETPTTTTTIYGTVFNSVTHEPIIGAQIEIGYRYGTSDYGHYNQSQDYRISSSVSGADGQFELQFGEVQMPNNPQNYSNVYFRWYYIYGVADGYKDNYRPTGITIGSNYRMDVNLDPK